MHPEFAPVAFLAAFLLAIPLIGTWRSGNISILSTIAWLFVTDMIYAVDAIVWAGNVDIRAPVWCDICELRLLVVHSPERF
jgi:pheromone a factor receptor